MICLCWWVIVRIKLVDFICFLVNGEDIWFRVMCFLNSVLIVWGVVFLLGEVNMFVEWILIFSFFVFVIDLKSVLVIGLWYVFLV